MAATAAQIVGRMRGWRVPYRQQLGTWDPALGNTRRPDPDVVGFGDCTSTIQNAFLKSGGPDPGYYTQDMRRRGKQVTSSAGSANFNLIQPGDVLLMQWHGGTWHAELAVNNTTCIGHPGPGAGPTEKNLRSYLGMAAYWEVRRHPLENTTTSSEDDELNSTEKKQLAAIHAFVTSADGARMPGRIRNFSDWATEGGPAGSQKTIFKKILAAVTDRNGVGAGVRSQNNQDLLTGGGPMGNAPSLLRQILAGQDEIKKRLDKLEGK